jgi:hypothetical protein
MHQVIKIYGVPSHKLAEIHELVKNTKTEAAFRRYREDDNFDAEERRGIARILSAEFNKEAGSYSVEIGVDMVIECADPKKKARAKKLLPSNKFILILYRILGVYYDKEVITDL